MTDVVISRVCVIGAGTMGSGIAAHLANLGFQVTLLDATPQSIADAFELAKSARPPHFYVPERANEIRLGSVQEDLALVSEADWVIEVIVERLEAKRGLYSQLVPLVSPHALISTNTSGLPIGQLVEGLPLDFQRRFVGTHFFNPPRRLKLLELITTPVTDLEWLKKVSQFLEEKVARRVVLARDTPGFIANRFGMWSMFKATHVAERLHLGIEEVDAITGPFLGRPRSGSFRLNDLVGLDVMRDIATNLVERCANDPHLSVFELPSSTLALIARGWIGEKSGQGYYRREGRELLALDLKTFAYRQGQEVQLRDFEALNALPLGERIRTSLERRDEIGEFLRLYLVPTLQYANWLKEKISYSVLDFDHVMEWGFGWQMGPFAMIDAIGADRLGIDAPPFYSDGKQRDFSGNLVSIPHSEPYRKLSDFPVVDKGETYVIRDLDDGVHAVSLSTKMGVIGPRLVQDLAELLERSSFESFILTSEARSFSAGYDLKFFQAAIEDGEFDEIDVQLFALQSLGEKLQRHKVVAAVFGHCLGAGLELALSCGSIVADAECQIGLPESRVGLIPGGRGTALVRLNNQHSAHRLSEVAIHLVEGTVAANAEQARQFGYLRSTDVTSFHPDRLLFEAKKHLMESKFPNVPAWQAVQGPLVGMIDRETASRRARREMTDYDEVISGKIRQIFAKSTSYEDAIQKERQEFVDLCRRSFTLARVRHMLDHGKSLRN